MPIAGLDYIPPVRSFRNFFGRYGTTAGSIRGVFNGVIPVAVIDRYRDDTEGSVFALSATAQAIANTNAAFAVGSATDDWELLWANWGLFFPGLEPAANEFNLMVYTPDFTFNPVTTPAPAGFFVPGMNTDFAFTLGSVSMVAGHRVGLPTRFGLFPFMSFGWTPASTQPNSLEIRQRPMTTFDPPIRVYRDVTLGFLMLEAATRAMDVTVSIGYRIRPRTTDGPRTGG